MQKTDFDSFYQYVIGPFIAEIVEQEKKNGLRCLIVDEDAQTSIFYYYQDKRSFLRNNYMKQKVNLSLDRHKVAACMMYAILKSNIISVDYTANDIPVTLLLAKQNLAFHVAINIVEMYKRQDDNEPITDYEIFFPITNHEKKYGQVAKDSEYVTNLLKAMYYVGDIDSFDIFAYSNILFLLEDRTDLIIGKTKSTNGTA